MPPSDKPITLKIMVLPMNTDWQVPEGYALRELRAGDSVSKDGKITWYAVLLKVPERPTGKMELDETDNPKQPAMPPVPAKEPKRRGFLNRPER